MRGLVDNSLLINSHYVRIHKLLGYEYEIYPIKLNGLKSFLDSDELSEMNFVSPFNEEVLEYLDETDEVSKAVGAVNTVIKKEGKLLGYNTDAESFEYLLKQNEISLENRVIIVLGDGVMAKVVRYVAEKQNAKKITFVSCEGDTNYENCYELQDTEVIINATPVGAMPDIFVSPIEVKRFSKANTVIDLVYFPLRTELMQQATEAGKKTVGGLMRLVAQAKYSEDLFNGEKTDDEIIKKVCADYIAQVRNVVLIGMPSCGKSTIGKLLATKLNCHFFDTDKEIEKEQNASIPKIFKSFGEKYFRALEKKKTESLATKKSCVISCGGGIILNETNIRNLRYNGVIVHIKRNISQLSTEGRPLSTSYEALCQMEKERMPLYKKYCDISVNNNGSLQKTVDKIMERLYENFSN